MTNPLVNMRPDPLLVAAARKKGLNLKELLEEAIKNNINTCPLCKSKLKEKNKPHNKGK